MNSFKTSKKPGLKAPLSCGACLLLLALVACKGGGGKSPQVRPAEPKVQAETPNPAPLLQHFEPAAGIPGTAVTLRGAHFTLESKVTFHGGVPARWELLNDHSILAWVPAGSASGPITIETKGGSVSSTPFTILPSRADALDAPFVEVPNSRDHKTRKVDFPGHRRTQQYEFFSLPKAPVFHPYHPYDPGDGSLRNPDKGTLQVNLNLKLPEAFYPALPASVRAKVAELALEPGHVDIFVVSQDQPWTSATPMLFRPHYWTDPDAPANGTYDKATRIHAGIFEAPGGVHFQGSPSGAFLEAGVQVHPDENTVIVSSPDNLGVAGLDPDHSQAFWTLTSTGTRAAATLHLILNDADQEALEELMPGMNTLRELVTQLEGSTLLAPTPMVASLKALTRPQATLTQLAAGASRKWIIAGNGFTGATAVSAGGHPLPAARFTVKDDTLLVVKLPAGTPLPCDLVITTPLGVSEPVHLAAAENRK